MLIGIAVVVIAAVIFLIIYNLRAAKSSKPLTERSRTEHKADIVPVTDTGRTETEAARKPEASTASYSGPESGSKPDSDLVKAPGQASQPPKGYPRANPGSLLTREQSDDEYREALRSFSAQGSSNGPSETTGDPSKLSKDEAYREGLRSLTKRD
ncbi:hypothetical protein HQN89_21455 [Paenibacillus frigoriresistens]|uniref:hypothetical protein n=1 Tax=Paenibacillus alginolyticus TaxID=59839 RepID=UPI0015662077|nr:hypothetical protein [Paenibacillus frigoriresistens]NRF93516.1 hypothetical protein [Paenibacillus frigoriresistens]